MRHSAFLPCHLGINCPLVSCHSRSSVSTFAVSVYLGHIWIFFNYGAIYVGFVHYRFDWLLTKPQTSLEVMLSLNMCIHGI